MGVRAKFRLLHCELCKLGPMGVARIAVGVELASSANWRPMWRLM